MNLFSINSKASASVQLYLAEMTFKEMRHLVICYAERVATGDLSENIGGLGKRSDEIHQIIGVITGIAGQTNLLALNASIESEHGSGFAIVSGEVGKLAEQ